MSKSIGLHTYSESDGIEYLGVLNESTQQHLMRVKGSDGSCIAKGDVYSSDGSYSIQDNRTRIDEVSNTVGSLSTSLNDLLSRYVLLSSAQRAGFGGWIGNTAGTTLQIKVDANLYLQLVVTNTGITLQYTLDNGTSWHDYWSLYIPAYNNMQSVWDSRNLLTSSAYSGNVGVHGVITTLQGIPNGTYLTWCIGAAYASSDAANPKLLGIGTNASYGCSGFQPISVFNIPNDGDSICAWNPYPEIGIYADNVAIQAIRIK